MAEKVILGLIEPVRIIGRNGKTVQIPARIDTGATSSSIDINLARNMGLGPVTASRIVRSASGVKRRPVLKVKLIIKETLIEEEFSLAERHHMTYLALIGQNVLRKGNFLIDPCKRGSRI